MLHVSLRQVFLLNTSDKQSSCEHTTQEKIEMSILLIWAPSNQVLIHKGG